MSRIITLWLPESFWTDSEEMEAREGLVAVRYKRGRGVEVSGTRDAFSEYKKRAEGFINPFGPDGSGLSGLKASARATVKKLEKAGI